MNGPEKRKLKEARMKYMELHPELWDKTKKEVVKKLKVLGLVAPTTYWKDVRL